MSCSVERVKCFGSYIIPPSGLEIKQNNKPVKTSSRINYTTNYLLLPNP
jgi:hypothetical protein